ncbi:MAG: hypothetical protein MJ224_02040 [archaeon]|nr:hypothetical protein [archaeon]
MEELLNIFSNYGTSAVCIAYLIYFQATTMKEMLSTLNSMNTRLSIIESKMGLLDENNKNS